MVIYSRSQLVKRYGKSLSKQFPKFPEPQQKGALVSILVGNGVNEIKHTWKYLGKEFLRGRKTHCWELKTVTMLEKPGIQLSLSLD